MSGVIAWLSQLWRWLFPPKRKNVFCSVAYVDSISQTDKPLRQGKLVVVGAKEHPKWLRFVCPCGCGEIVALNLMKSHSPRWTVALHDDSTLTVHPSIDSKTCRSHYWIRQNQVHWV